MLRSEDLELKHAKADGNCAFNALALRLVEDDIIEILQQNFSDNASKQDVEKFQNFLVKLRAELDLVANATWSDIKDRLKTLKKTNEDKLQAILAPLLRGLAIDLIEKNTEEDETIVLLSPAFREYVYKKFGIPMSESGFRGDDILNPHPFIREKFEASFDKIVSKLQLNKDSFDYKQFCTLRDKKDEASQLQFESMKITLRDHVLGPLLDEQKDDLESWWTKGKKEDKEKSKSGRQQFLDVLRKAAESANEIDRYAGDLELAANCNFLKINLIAQRNHNDIKLTDIKGKKAPVPTIFLVNNGGHWNYLAPKKPAGKVNPSSEAKTPKSSLFSTHNAVDPNVAINDVNAISKVLKATTSSPSWVDLGKQAQDQKSASQKIKLKLGNETIEEKTDGTVQYSFFLNPGKANSTLLTTITVTADDQKKLDAVLARQLQEEEYEEYKNSLKK